MGYCNCRIYPRSNNYDFGAGSAGACRAGDSGGVTTGPMTVPFIMALGGGISAIRNDKHAENDSFGLVALCSIGPIIAVLILGMLYSTDSSFAEDIIYEVSDSVELGKVFLQRFPRYFKEIALSFIHMLD